MRKTLLFPIAAVVTVSCGTLRAQTRKGMDVYFIDVEGGQSTLIVSPSGQSLLVDTGWPGTRDADRILRVAKLTGFQTCHTFWARKAPCAVANMVI